MTGIQSEVLKNQDEKCHWIHKDLVKVSVEDISLLLPTSYILFVFLFLGIKELLSTADNPYKGKRGTISDLFFMTGTIAKNFTEQMGMLKRDQPNKPIMAMEYYPGWFDFWGSRHNTKALDVFRNEYETFLKYPASVNLYMFHGGTNFGFLNGAQNLKLDDKNTGNSY